MIGNEYRQGRRAIVVVVPTGGGKTVLSTALISRHLAKRIDGKALFVAHREELVSQAFDTLEAAGLECGVIQANPTRIYNPFRPVQVASTQTLISRKLVIEGVTMLVLDECHHYLSDRWCAIGDEYKKRGALVIGLTATPIRGDGRGLNGS